MTPSLSIVTPVPSEAAGAAGSRPLTRDGHPSTAELTRALAAGDEDAFRTFHRLYFDRLLRLALVLAHGDPTAAADIVQDTVCRVARYARRLEAEEVFWCWLAALARSAAVDAGRKRSRYLALLQDYARRWLVLDPPETSDDDLRLETLASQCLDELDPADRALVAGKYFDGQSVRELAQHTQTTEKAVESRLVRLRQRLRSRLLERLKDPGP